MVKINKKHLNTNSEAGNIAFYVAFVIPISLVFLIIVIDISQWQFLREQAQRDADRIALEVANHLPYEELANTFVREKIASYNSTSENLQIQQAGSENTFGSAVTADTVSIEIGGKHESLTDSLLSAASGNEVVLSVLQTSSAKIVPYDVMIVFSDAISLRPEGYQTFGTTQDFPHSEYFNLIGTPRISVSPPPTAPRAWPNWWETSVFNNLDYKRWATQLCYNPMTLPLKQSLVMIADHVGGSKSNRVGVYASPGDAYQGVGFSVIKEFSFMASDNNNVRWSSYFEPDAANSDEACVLYAHSDLGMQTYAIPPLHSFLTQRSVCETTIAKNPFSSPTGHYPNPLDSSLSPCFTQTGGPALRDAIYYRAVRMHPHEVGAANISKSIYSALSRLVEEEKSDPAAQLTSRKGLSSSSSKLLIVISDAVPAFSDQSIQDVLQFIDNSENFKFYMFTYNHQALNPALQANNINTMQAYSSVTNNRFVAKIVDESSLINEIKSLLINEKRIVISS